MENRAFKATLMRGTLHLVSAREFDLYRVASRFPTHIWSDGLKQLVDSGVDVAALRKEILDSLDVKALKKPELQKAFRHRIPAELPDWVAFSVVVTVGATINVAEDARFGHFAALGIAARRCRRPTQRTRYARSSRPTFARSALQLVATWPAGLAGQSILSRPRLSHLIWLRSPATIAAHISTYPMLRARTRTWPLQSVSAQVGQRSTGVRTS
jgi:hypothetical protein